MKMNVQLDMSGVGGMPRTMDKKDAKVKKRRLSRVREAISKYVSFEEDAIFKDPDWPHLWDHKREK